jgi:protein gp37
MKMAARLARMEHSAVKYSGLTVTTKAGPVWNGVVRLDQSSLSLPLAVSKPTTFFVNSMSDLGHENLSDDAIARVWGVMRAANHHDYQVLTKRPARLRRFLGSKTAQDLIAAETARHRRSLMERDSIWIGTSVENQTAADERIPELMHTPAAIRFLSVEPLLGMTSIRRVIESELRNGGGRIHWVIVGGESGPGARPMHPTWARQIRDECEVLGITFFFKQIGSWHWKSHDSVGRGASQALMPNGTLLSTEQRPWPDDAQPIIFGRKKEGGRHLDGKLYNEMPLSDLLAK